MKVTQFFSQNQDSSNLIRNRLEMELRLDYLLNHLKTIHNALAYISEKINIEIEVEEEVKDSLSLNLCYLNFLDIEKISVMDFFHIVFPPQNLKWFIANDKVYIQSVNPDKMVLKTYDISDLVSDDTTTTEVAPKNIFQVFGENPEASEIKNSDYYLRWEIVNLIKNQVLSKYKYNNALVSANTGKLFVSHFPIVHQHIETFLTELRRLSHYEIATSIGFVSFKSNFFKQTNISFSPIIEQEDKHNFICLFSILNETQGNQFLESVADSTNTENICTKQVSLHHLKGRNISKVHKTDFLAGQHEQTDNIGRMFAGVTIKAQPEIKNNGITFDFEIKIIDICQPIVTFPIKGGEIALPNQTVQTIKTKVHVPYKHTLVLAGFSNPFQKKNDKTFIGNHKQENLMLYFNAKLDSFFD